MIPDQAIKEARILIVEDEPTILMVLVDMLRRAGYHNVVSTTDPGAAISLVLHTNPDLIILDLLMPEVDGIEILQQIRENTPGDVYLPILVITGDPRSERKLQALLLGAKDFLLKPFDAFEVMLRIRNLLEARMLYRRASSAAARERNAS